MDNEVRTRAPDRIVVYDELLLCTRHGVSPYGLFHKSIT
jgi:hypothetical protein